ncbi:hypothetical protein NDU88_006095 [Pleurodeles waltl]|uniref:Uncharacterized protein n=1 Tax=Pleurodeles waltl TaxID=8319 RepID=A0AAV7RQ86_PLEWA|nr:hypothetical protein NDU88_006095 [Pleurodeles waltl]
MWSLSSHLLDDGGWRSVHPGWSGVRGRPGKEDRLQESVMWSLSSHLLDDGGWRRWRCYAHAGSREGREFKEHLGVYFNRLPSAMLVRQTRTKHRFLPPNSCTNIHVTM